MFRLENFNPAADNGRVQTLTTAFIDAMGLVKRIVDTVAWDTPTFDIYFPPEARGDVAAVFQRMYDGHPDGAAVLSQVVFDNKAPVDSKDSEHRDVCVADHWAAYTVNRPAVPEPTITVCPNSWSITQLRDVAEKACKSSQISLE